MTISAEENVHSHRPYPWRQIVIWTISLVGIAYLLTRHASHVIQFLPFLFLFACPLMHMFHHRHRHRH